MGILKRLADLLGGGRRNDDRNLRIYVVGNRCGEPIAAEVDTMNSLSQTDDGSNEFYTRKMLQGSGKNRCFEQIEVELWFDRSKRLLRHEVKGGRWLSADKYEAELERFNAPPEDEEGLEAAGGGSGDFG